MVARLMLKLFLPLAAVGIIILAGCTPQQREAAVSGLPKLIDRIADNPTATTAALALATYLAGIFTRETSRAGVATTKATVAACKHGLKRRKERKEALAEYDARMKLTPQLK